MGSVLIHPFSICMVITYWPLLSVRTIYLPLPPVIDGVWANAHCYIVSALYTVVQLMQQSQFTVFLQVICDD